MKWGRIKMTKLQVERTQPGKQKIIENMVYHLMLTLGNDAPFTSFTYYLKEWLKNKMSLEQWKEKFTKEYSAAVEKVESLEDPSVNHVSQIREIEPPNINSSDAKHSVKTKEDPGPDNQASVMKLDELPNIATEVKEKDVVIPPFVDKVNPPVETTSAKEVSEKEHVQTTETISESDVEACQAMEQTLLGALEMENLPDNAKIILNDLIKLIQKIGSSLAITTNNRANFIKYYNELIEKYSSFFDSTELVRETINLSFIDHSRLAPTSRNNAFGA